MTYFLSFFNNPFFVVMGGIATLLAVLSSGYIIFLIIKGVLPVWYRLGIGLSKSKIAIFSTGGDFSKLKSMVICSKIFKEKNIIDEIHKGEIKPACGAKIFLVHWKYFKDEIEKIIDLKKDDTALIVYAPKEEGAIDDKNLSIINNERNSLIVNFRGRLINDMLISLVTANFRR